jgi:hypothetical protein
MTGRSHSTDPLVLDGQLCPWCFGLLASHSPFEASRHALRLARAAQRWTDARAGAARETPAAAQADAGSSSTRRGAGASRSWSVTGSSGSVCRRLRRARSDSFWESVRSARGMGTGRTSGSSKSSTGEDVTTGTVEVTLVESAEVQREEGSLNDCEFGWMGFHYWQDIPFAPEGTRKCLMCGRVKP